MMRSVVCLLAASQILISCASNGVTGIPIIDTFSFDTATVAQTPRSFVLRYNRVSSSLQEASDQAQEHCVRHNRDAVLRSDIATSRWINEAHFDCF